jgi:hypothetical protein
MVIFGELFLGFYFILFFFCKMGKVLHKRISRIFKKIPALMVEDPRSLESC